MFRKASNTLFLTKNLLQDLCFKTSRDSLLQRYWSTAWKKIRCTFTAVPFLRKYIVKAVKRVGADLMEFAVPETAEVVSGTESVNRKAKSVGGQPLKNIWVVVAEKRVQIESFRQNM